MLGGYALAVGLCGLVAQALTAAMPRSEAVVLMCMLAFVVYLIVLLWAFAERRPWRLWLLLGGGSIGSNGALFWLASAAGTTAGG